MFMEVVIKGANIYNKEDFHLQVAQLLNLSGYYGENLDALWDSLINDLKRPVIVIWKDFNLSKVQLGEYADKARSVFENADMDNSIDLKFICA